MTHKIDGKLLGLEGEWQLNIGNFEVDNPDYVVIKRVPDKSELEKWAEKVSVSNNMFPFLEIGFKKAIEVAEEWDSLHLMSSNMLVKYLQKFAGIK